MKRLYDWACDAAEALSSAALALVAVLNLLLCTVLATDESVMVIVRNGLPYLASLALWAALLWLLAGNRRAFSRLRPETVFAVCAAAYVLMTAYLLGNVYQWRLVGDAEAIYYTAKDLRQGVYDRLKAGGYIARYPHQLGLASVVSAVMGVSEAPVFLRWVNLALVLLTNFALLRACMTLPGATRATGSLSVLLSFLLVPQLLHIVFIYGNIPGLCLMLLAAMALFAWLRGGRGAYAALAVALVSLAYLVRNNILIACVALAILCVLAFMRGGRRRTLVIAVCLIAVPLLLPRALWAHTTRVSGEEPTHGIPSLAWVTMGMQEDGSMPGWYNNYTDRLYYQSGYDPQTVREIAMHDLREQLYDFRQDPVMALRFFGRKLVSTWCEPTFGCIAIAGFQQEDCRTPLLRSLYGGGTAFAVLREAMHGLLTLVYALSALYPWLRRKAGAPRSAYALFAQVFFLGGFLFHILWETKSLYVLCYCLCLAPVAAQSATMLVGRARARREGKAASAA